jgi:LCP family protein required for cell wall assembly
MSAFVPGTGHLYLGYRRIGWVLITVTVAAVIPAALLAVALFVTRDLRVAVEISRPFLEHPTLLLVLMALNIALLGFRAVAVIDAYRLGSDAPTSQGRQILGGVAVAAIIVAVALPHWWVGERDLALYDLLTYDFVADPGFGAGGTVGTLPPTTAPPPTPATDTATTQATTTTQAPPTSSTTGPPTTTAAATTIPDPAAPSTTVPLFVDTTDRITIALLGGDAGPGRFGIRTDTIIVVTVDTATGDAAMFSVPRNLQELPIPEDHPAHDAWGCGCLPDLANTIYQTGLARSDLFPGGPNPGINATKTIIGNLLGIEIDYVALVALENFVELIDALGGIDITVVKPVDDPGQVQPDGSIIDVVIPPGDYRFDGRTALAYARARRQDSDYFRMDRQRCVLEAVVEQFDTFTLLQRLPEISAAVRAGLVTDLPLTELPDFFDLADRIDADRIVALRFVPDAPDLAGTGLSYVLRSATTGRYPVADVPLIRERVRIALEQPPEEAIVSLNAPSLDEVCR